MIWGIDYLGGAKYFDVIKKAHLRDWAIGGFANTFGDFFKVAEWGCSKVVPVVRIQILWSDTHSFGDKDIKAIRKEAKRYEELQKRYPETRIELSPFCEHNLGNPDKYLDIIAEVAPSCRPVNTPWKGALSKKYKNEIHNKATAPKGDFNFSYDGGINGADSVDTDVQSVKSALSSADVFFFWHVRLNLKWSMKDKTPRPQRTAKPTPELVRSLIWLAGDKGSTSLPKKWLCKSHAEKHGATDSKGDKLLIISPVKANKIELKSNGQTVGQCNYFGSYEGGGYRYYSPQFGFQIAKKAQELSGSPVCDVVANGKSFGKVNPGFRDTTFR